MQRRVGVCLPDKSFFGITASAAFERRDYDYLFHHYLGIVTNGSFSFDCGTSVVTNLGKELSPVADL